MGVSSFRISPVEDTIKEVVPKREVTGPRLDSVYLVEGYNLFFIRKPHLLTNVPIGESDLVGERFDLMSRTVLLHPI